MSSIKRKFPALVQDDLTLKFVNPGAVKQAVLQYRGALVSVTIDKQRKTRSDMQNRYYFAVVVRMIADHCGYSGSDELEGLHEELKRRFLPKQGSLGIVKSTASLNTQEFSDYIEDVRRWAANELSLYIPDANETTY